MNILDKIVAVKRDEVARLRPQAGQLKQAAAGRKDYRDFVGAVVGRVPSRGAASGDAAYNQTSIRLIAEIKKASPSAGVIKKDFDATNLAREYEAAGAHALSVLTDQQFFQGHLNYLRLIRDTVRLPLLRKDFTIDELQIYEAVAGGADAILLITAILDDAQLASYRQLAEQLRLAALVEVHDERELDRAVASGAGIIGINNRDLKSFSVDLKTTERLAGKCGGRTIVAESGINTRADVQRVARAGATAILVGESLMRSGDIAGKVRELLGYQN
jgi:indole-3-glycerol phosphate synthase